MFFCCSFSLFLFVYVSNRFTTGFDLIYFFLQVVFQRMLVLILSINATRALLEDGAVQPV